MAEREIEMEGPTPDDGQTMMDTPDSEVEEPGNEKPSVFDYNVYSTQKTIAKGLLDVALLANNAAHIKLLVESEEENKFYTLLMVLLPISIILQVVVGILLLVLGQLKITTKGNQSKAKLINNVTSGLVFLIVVLNIIISAFHTNATVSTTTNTKEP